MSNIVKDAIEADLRATAARWAKQYYVALYSEGDWSDLTAESRALHAEAMLPIVREAAQATTDALLQRHGLGWKILGDIMRDVGLAEDAPVKDLLTRVQALVAKDRL
jgi:hypothetical protein